MKHVGKIAAAFFVVALGSPVFADRDSNAMSPEAVTTAVRTSDGVMIRVPVDEQGRELAIAAEMRVVDSSASSPSDLPSVWTSGTDMTNVPQVDSSTDSDSSTNWGWGTWHPHLSHWYPAYYYNSYVPAYYYGGYAYNYGNPVYGNYYAPFVYGSTYPAWGYRYYYYPRFW